MLKKFFRPLYVLTNRLFISFVFVSFFSFAFAQKLVTPGYLFNSDPTCRELNGKFYLFTTHDPFTEQEVKENAFWKGMYDYQAFSTSDFNTWTHHGSILAPRDCKWATGSAVWDGDAGVPANGKYYAYIPFRMTPDSIKSYGKFAIGVFVSDRIEGPYKDALGHPMMETSGIPLLGLSPTVVKGDDGKTYLYFGGYKNESKLPFHDILIGELKSNMTEFAAPLKGIEVIGALPGGALEFFEAPILFKRKDLWYMTYVSKNNGKGTTYQPSDPKGFYVRYATSNNMTGPFTQNIKSLIYPTNNPIGNVHHGICQYKGKWYIAYHVHASFMHRQACVTPLVFKSDGNIEPIYPERDKGAGTSKTSSLILDAYASKREAVEYHASAGAASEKGLKGEYHMKLTNGAYLRFNRMNFFEKGAKTFSAQVSRESTSISQPILEVRLDSARGKKIASLKVPTTGGALNYQTVSSSAIPASGMHDVYLTASSEGSGNDSALFNVTWFSFQK